MAASAYQFKPVWRNMYTQRDLSQDEMQLFVNSVYHPCVAVVVGPSIIVQRNFTKEEIASRPSMTNLASREALQALLMDAQAAGDFARVAELSRQLGQLTNTLEKKSSKWVHQDTYKNTIVINRVPFQYVATSEQEVDSAEFEAKISVKVTLSAEINAKVTATVDPQ